MFGVYMNHDNTDISLQYPIEWVTIDKCSALVGLSKDAINAHRVKGNLRIDVHWTKCKGRVFINMPAFQRWISTGH